MDKPGILERQAKYLQQILSSVSPILWAILVGLGAGALAVVRHNVETQWAGIILIATAAFPVILLVKDIRKLILIALVVDLALGIDIAVQNQGWHQGGPTGYLPRERIAVPNDPMEVLVNQAFAWNPSIRGTKSEDTVLVGADGNEILSAADRWPLLDVELDGPTWQRPDILVVGT